MTKRRSTPPLVETLSKDSQRLFSVLNDALDLSGVLIAASFLDECLASMLHGFFVRGNTAARLLDPIGGPLGTFSARADLAYVLGLVSKPALADLRLVAELRNLFAHSRLGLDFSSTEAQGIIDRFEYLSILCQEARLGGQDPSLLEGPLSPRDRFKLTVVMLSSHLLLKGLNVEHRERFVGWVQRYSQPSQPHVPRRDA